jgi:CRISPR-associated endonuclease/helicase Cas3
MATEQSQSLTVVNTKKDALALFRLLRKLDPQALYLSTDLCSKHRREVVARVKQRLAAGEPCHLVSTQLIEAGVDLDFPLVLRALAPLDSLIQTAGRCNREGKLTMGRVIIFQPGEGGSPGDEYKRRVNITRKLYGAGYRDLNMPEVAYKYFQDFYQVESTDRPKINELRAMFDYPKVAQEFRMIKDDAMNVVVKFGDAAEQEKIAQILSRLKAGTPASRFLLRELQPYTVAVRTTKVPALVKQRFIAPILPDLGEWLGSYDKDAGLIAEDFQAEDLII